MNDSPEDDGVSTTAGGCCVAPLPNKEALSRGKYILVYPYTDPEIPFEDLKPEQITFYFHVTNQTGHPAGPESRGMTCGAQCNGCYFKTLPEYSVDSDLAQRVARDFRAKGYDIGLVTADSFSDLSLYKIGQAGSAFRYDIAEQNGNAWTNGKQLSRPDVKGRLNRGWELGYGVVTISLYGVAVPHPMKGIPDNRFVETGIQNIRAWNQEKFPKGGGYRIIGTQLINKQTCNLDSMRAAAQYCLANGISVCRFNAFANFLQREDVAEYELNADDIRSFWRNLAVLQEEFLDTPLQFGVSEDMSATGIEACIPFFNPADGWEKFDPEQPYWCRAGYRLFSINGVKDKVSGAVKLVITACVDNWDKAPIGEVVLGEDGKYKPVFDVPRIEAIRRAVRSRDISTCWGGVGNPSAKGGTRGFVPDLVAERALFAK